jgi:predicted NUDIX family NTP pyrophosphohydrolase
MAARISAGILLYRRLEGRLEVLLAHPGGPRFAHRDQGYWSIPKGEVEPGESLADVARREFEEETGHHLGPVELFPLGDTVQKGGKVVYAWAAEGDLDPATATSNTFATEWPVGSGDLVEIPEVDRVAWFEPAEAGARIKRPQAVFVDRLVDRLRERDAQGLPQALAFDNAYEGTPTWDIGRPQPAVLRLLQASMLVGDVLDVGCGTGEHARLLAARGHRVLGIDFSARAIALARGRVASPGSKGPEPEFAVADVRDLADLGRRFDTVLDVGCFHTLQPGDRAAYAASIRGALRPGGGLILLCWSDRNAFGYGPQRIRRRDIRATFREGWTIERLEAEELDTRMDAAQVHAWLAIVRREHE